MINHPNIAPWPFYEQDELDAAMSTLQSGKVNYWTGELGRQFEELYAKSVGKTYGIALSNGTVALELALRAFAIGIGDEVIVTSRSYVASASCVMLVGAIPVFADVEAASGNISVDSIKGLITEKTKAIIPVHVGGLPCNMSGIMSLADLHGLVVIEDCAQAHGASIDGKPVGSWGQAAIFSFCQDKIISTGGEGGMLLLDDLTAFKRAWAYKDIGRSYDAVYNQQHPVGFRWLTDIPGSNFRMTEFQAAIGLKQLNKLPSWIEKRNKNAELLTKVLEKYDFIELCRPDYDANIVNAYYRLYARVRTGAEVKGTSGEKLRNRLVALFEQGGVPCFFGSCAEIYREKAFGALSSVPKSRLPNAAIWADNGFCFLTHHTIKREELEKLCDAVERLLTDLIV